MRIFILFIALFINARSIAASQCSDQTGMEGGAAGAFYAGNYLEASRRYLILANCGNRAGQYHLGMMYAEGDGVTKDYAEASRLFLLAAEQGDSRAQLAIGTSYLNGYGVIQDYVKAHMWLNVAATTAVDESLREYRELASQYRESISLQMTAQQIGIAQEMADLCIKSMFKECDAPKASKPAEPKSADKLNLPDWTVDSPAPAK